MDAASILEDQVIHVKRGRLNGLGFEPAFNAYFDFYLNTKYFGHALLNLEDVTFHLYLRKNLNAQNPKWKMPSIRQMKHRFGIGQPKLEAMMARLEKAHLLRKESGLLRRQDGKTARNNYILSDPIPTLEEFLAVAREEVFGEPLLPEFSRTQNRYVLVPVLGTSLVPDLGTDQQTLKTEQTDESFEEQIWNSVLSIVKMQLVTNTFYAFAADTQLKGIEDGVATITTPKPFAVEWLTNRMSANFRKLLNMELRLRDGEKASTIEEIRIEIFSSPDE